jgi:hypothetical protein
MQPIISVWLSAWVCMEIMLTDTRMQSWVRSASPFSAAHLPLLLILVNQSSIKKFFLSFSLPFNHKLNHCLNRYRLHFSSFLRLFTCYKEAILSSIKEKSSASILYALRWVFLSRLKLFAIYPVERENKKFLDFFSMYRERFKKFQFRSVLIRDWKNYPKISIEIKINRRSKKPLLYFW